MPPKTERQKRVVAAFLHGWQGYKAYCWGSDELLPLSRNCSSEFGGLGAQIVDAMDSLWMMGLEKEYKEARRWVVKNFTSQLDVKASVFEVCIRILGGLLSAHFLSDDKKLLRLATDLGTRLLRAWREGPLPHELVNLKTGEVGEREAGLGSSLAEVGTLQLELSALSMATGDLRFRTRSEHVMDFLGSLLVEEGGLLPIMLRPEPPIRWTNSRVTLGGRGDSFYEYLLKQWLMTNRTEDRYKMWYQEFVGAIQTAFVARSSPSNITFVREVDSLEAIRPFLGKTGKPWQPQDSVQAVVVEPMTFIMQVQQAPEIQNQTSSPAVEEADNSSASSTEEPEQVREPQQGSDAHTFLEDLLRRTMQTVHEMEGKLEAVQEVRRTMEGAKEGTLGEQFGASGRIHSENVEGGIDHDSSDARADEVENKEYVQGEWYGVPNGKFSGGVRGSIVGSKLKWNNGEEQSLEMITSTQFTSGGYVAELKNDGKLYWSDGDVWLRSTQEHSMLPGENIVEIGKDVCDDDLCDGTSQEHSALPGESIVETGKDACDDDLCDGTSQEHSALPGESNVETGMDVCDDDLCSGTSQEHSALPGLSIVETGKDTCDDDLCDGVVPEGKDSSELGTCGTEDPETRAGQVDDIAMPWDTNVVEEEQCKEGTEEEAQQQLQQGSLNEQLMKMIQQMFGGGAADMQKRMIYVQLPRLHGEEICAMIEKLQSRRWDLLHGTLKIAIPEDSAMKINAPLLETVAGMVSQQLAPHCENLGYQKMDHLACFLPGLLALGVLTGAAKDPEAELSLAAGLAEGCAKMWLGTPLGLAPESVAWNVVPGRTSDMKVLPDTVHSILRPETVESLWYLYVATGDRKYQDWGWSIFEAIEQHCRVDTGGFCGIENVLEVEAPRRRDRMETFLLSETFKYLFLLFADDPSLLDLTQVVFNTEAHPLPVFDPRRMR